MVIRVTTQRARASALTLAAAAVDIIADRGVRAHR
jgi:hypothetical protein